MVPLLFSVCLFHLCLSAFHDVGSILQLPFLVAGQLLEFQAYSLFPMGSSGWSLHFPVISAGLGSHWSG